jgi:hypothetical protein
VDNLSSKFVLPLKPWSVNILQLRLGAAISSDAVQGLLKGVIRDSGLSAS